MKNEYSRCLWSTYARNQYSWFTVEILKLVENRYENLDKKFQGNWLILVMWVN